MKEPRKTTSADPQLDGGPDIDTTSQDGPTGYESHAGSLIGENKGEHGPLDSAKDALAIGDPTGDDPFVPGTGEAKDDFDPDDLLSEKEKHLRAVLRAKDPKGDDGPTYEAHQGNAPQQLGGSTDPNSSLTEETSGLQKEQ